VEPEERAGPLQMWRPALVRVPQVEAPQRGVTGVDRVTVPVALAVVLAAGMLVLEAQVQWWELEARLEPLLPGRVLVAFVLSARFHGAPEAWTAERHPRVWHAPPHRHALAGGRSRRRTLYIERARRFPAASRDRHGRSSRTRDSGRS
jgi:hypothetical protein